MKSNTATTRAIRGDTAAIWRRLPNEPAQAYATFCLYREQVPPRSVPRIAKQLQRGLRQLELWSSRWRWVERADAYIDHLDRVLLAAHEEDIVRRRREENERLYTIGHDLQDAGRARLIGRGDSVLPLDLNTLKPDDVTRFLDLGNKFVRLSVGLPLDMTGATQVSLSDLQRILGAFIDIAEKHMDEDSHEALVRECYAMVREQLGG